MFHQGSLLTAAQFLTNLCLRVPEFRLASCVTKLRPSLFDVVGHMVSPARCVGEQISKSRNLLEA